MTALRKKDDVPALPVVQSSEAATVLSMIERIAALPEVPVERIEQMFSLYTKMDAERARRAYHASFAEMQPALPQIERKGKSHNGKFARWEDVSAGVMPVLAKFGFGLSFRISEAPGKVIVKCILSHSQGHSEETEHPFPYDTSGSKNAIQSIGSAASYGKRYTASSMLGIATRDEDDDGNAAERGPTITEDQQIELRDIIEAKSLSEPNFCKYMKVAKLSELPAAKFCEAKTQLVKAVAR